MLTRPLLKFVSLYSGSNYLCTNLEMGSLSLKMEAIFLELYYNNNVHYIRVSYVTHYITLQCVALYCMIWRYVMLCMLCYLLNKMLPKF